MALSFSSIGALLKRGIVDEKVFFEVFTPSIIIWTWEKMQPIVSFRRETMNFSIYSGFEYMAKKAKEHYPEIRSIKDYEKQVISKVKTKP